MPQNANTTISLSPGTRECGVAVFDDMDLLYYATKDLSKHRQGNTTHSLAREAVHVIEDLIYKYQPASFVVRTLQPLQQFSPKLVHIAAQLQAAGGRQGLAVHECAPKEARKLLCPYQRATRQNAAARLATLYPELSRYLANVTCWQRLYYEPMFDAITIGYCYQQAAVRERERRAIEADDASRTQQAFKHH